MSEVPDLAVDPLAVLTTVLKKLIPNPSSVSLTTPTFDWNSTEQHDDFQLFCKSVDSWFTLQNVAPKLLQETHQQTLAPPIWSMSSTFWAMLATKSLIDGSQLVLMLRLPRRRRVLKNF